MSHLQTSEVVITDIELFERIVATVPGLTWNHNEKRFKWYSSNVGDCDHCITQTNPKKGLSHQIGVVRSTDEDGQPCWKIQFDPYDSGLAEIIGHSGQKLMNKYSEAYAVKFAEANGFIVERKMDNEGNLVLDLIDINS